jgi:hypothetical protein
MKTAKVHKLSESVQRRRAISKSAATSESGVLPVVIQKDSTDNMRDFVKATARNQMKAKTHITVRSIEQLQPHKSM